MTLKRPPRLLHAGVALAAAIELHKKGGCVVFKDDKSGRAPGQSLHLARRRQRIPIRLDDTVLKTKEAWAGLVRRDRNIGDFTRWKDHDAYKRSFERVVRNLTMPAKPPVP
jgi:hypothetical protein